MGKLHDRMPVILADADWPKWLGEAPATEEELVAMLTPCPDDMMRMWPVDKRSEMSATRGRICSYQFSAGFGSRSIL
jgi:putative SOS response-associated peptidase YedK